MEPEQFCLHCLASFELGFACGFCPKSPALLQAGGQLCMAQ